MSRLAAAQHGAVSVKQLRAAGFTPRTQKTAVAAGWLRHVEPNVVVVAGSPDTWYRRLWSGLLALDGKGWVSHEAAAALHGLDRAVTDTIEFTVGRGSRKLTCAATVHTTKQLAPLDQVTVHGLRASSATRTIIDLARARIPKHRLEAAIDSAVRRGLSAPIVLERRLTELRGPGRWGARALDGLLVDSGGESMLERRFLALMRQAGLPRPTTHAVPRHDGGMWPASTSSSIRSPRSWKSLAGAPTLTRPSAAGTRSVATSSLIWGSGCSSTRGPTSRSDRRGSCRRCVSAPSRPAGCPAHLGHLDPPRTGRFPVT